MGVNEMWIDRRESDDWLTEEMPMGCDADDRTAEYV